MASNSNYMDHMFFKLTKTKLQKNPPTDANWQITYFDGLWHQSCPHWLETPNFSAPLQLHTTLGSSPYNMYTQERRTVQDENVNSLHFIGMYLASSSARPLEPLDRNSYIWVVFGTYTMLIGYGHCSKVYHCTVLSVWCVATGLVCIIFV